MQNTELPFDSYLSCPLKQTAPEDPGGRGTGIGGTCQDSAHWKHQATGAEPGLYKPASELLLTPPLELTAPERVINQTSPALLHNSVQTVNYKLRYLPKAFQASVSLAEPVTLHRSYACFFFSTDIEELLPTSILHFFLNDTFTYAFHYIHSWKSTGFIHKFWQLSVGSYLRLGLYSGF